MQRRVFIEIRLRGTITALMNEKEFLSKRLDAVTEKAKETNTKLQESWLETAQASKLTKQTEELYIKLEQLTDERAVLESKACMRSQGKS